MSYADLGFKAGILGYSISEMKANKNKNIVYDF